MHSQHISRSNISEFTKNPRKTYFIITGIVSIIAIVHLLPHQTQARMACVFRENNWLFAVVLIGSLGLCYFNWIAGLLILFLLICVLFPLTFTTQIQNNTTEGFAASAANDISLKNKAITSLFEPGLLGKRLEEQRATNKQIKSENAAKNKSIQILNSHRAEKFGAENTGRKREDFREIELRKFDPTSEDDMNLLLTMEHCGDIQNRIKYVYEDTKYLKKYIRDKMEDIVDLLDLVPEDE